ncbi:SubName: Full=Uncharacterized protein {ECO:0000313/EMBL:CCA66644.1} [Serendipita indica DSM 11827]|nr:SubName: Full=Uncharacterized protein {ECO:0000313/EMBL:CCA66644.1} [Serendipita indica DSM 11827]
MSLNEFLGDATFGSWADEMEDFPTAPAHRAGGEESRGTALSRAPDRAERSYPAREELPLPTQPPYTAFVGNLTFDMTERQLGDHFSPSEASRRPVNLEPVLIELGLQIKSVKIIKDREDKPKGFGYVEFETLDGLKSALEKSQSNLAGRMIRVSVADPPKEREGRPFGDRGSSGAFDDDRQWRREGPLPPAEDRRGGFGGSRGFDRSGGNRFGDSGEGDKDRGERMGFGSKFQSREPAPPSIAEETSDWRSTMKAPAPPPQQDRGSRMGDHFGADGARRRGSGAGGPRGYDSPKLGPADLEEKWTIGSRFKPSQPSPEREGGAPSFTRKFSNATRPEPQPDASDEVQDWRSAPRKIVSGPPPSGPPGRGSMDRGPSSAAPPARRKLELLPRTGGDTMSPLASPKSGEATPASATATKPNPFGGARPVDAAAREREITEKMERAKLTSTPLQSNATLGSRPTSRQGSRAGSRQGSPTRSPRSSGLGLGGMNNPSTPNAPKILPRSSGNAPMGRPGGHGRAPSVTMSPKRGPSSAGEWRRDSTGPGLSSSQTNSEAPPTPTGPLVERKQSIVRPSFSFANAAGGGASKSSAGPASKPTTEQAPEA